MVDWPTKKLGDVAKIEGGGTPSTTNPLFWNGDVPWLTPKELSDFSDSEIFDTERKITNEGLNRSSTKLFPAGTVLFTSRAPIGYVVIAGIEMATNQGFKNFICDEKILSNKFLYYFLKFKTKYLQSLGRGATFTEISRSILAKVDIPIPSLTTQKQIVERLDKIAEAQKLNDDLIQKTDELFQSLLHQELNPVGKNWEVKKLSEVGEIITGTTPSTKNREYWNGEFLWATPTDIKENTFILTDTPKKLSHEGYKRTRPVSKNAILVTCIASIGKMAIAGKEMATNQQINSIVCNKNSNPFFVFFSLQKDKKKLISLGKTTAVPIINKSEFGRIKILLPPLETQKQIVAKLSAVQEYKTQLLEQKAKLKELFDSALHKSMTNK